MVYELYDRKIRWIQCSVGSQKWACLAQNSRRDAASNWLKPGNSTRALSSFALPHPPPSVRGEPGCEESPVKGALGAWCG